MRSVSVRLPSVHVIQAKCSLFLCMTLPTLTEINSKIATWVSDTKASAFNGRQTCLGSVPCNSYVIVPSLFNLKHATPNKEHTWSFQVRCILHFRSGCSR